MVSSLWRKFFKVHVLASILTSQLSLFSGFTHAYSAILIAQLFSESSSIKIDISEASWIASLGTMCRPLGALMEIFVIDKYGRKTSIQITIALHSMAWIFLSFSEDLFSIYVARIVTSLATGMENACGIYVTEISPASQRGTLLSLMAPITASGTLITYTLGYLLSWRLTALIFGIYGCFVLISLCFIYDTPIWYMLKNKKHYALRSLLWLRDGNKTEVKAEMEDLEIKISSYQTDEMKFYLKHFMDRSVWKPFMIILAFSLLQKSAGHDAIFAYAVNFFELFKTEINENVLSIVFAIISLIGSLNIISIAHKFDRTTIIFISGLGMSLSLVIAAIFLELNETSVTVICIFFYIYFCMSGMVTVPYMIIFESFPNHARGVMSAAVSIFIFLPSFINTKLYPTFVEFLQPFGLLCYYSFFSLSAAVFSKLFIFETRGRNLAEIEAYYAS